MSNGRVAEEATSYQRQRLQLIDVLATRSVSGGFDYLVRPQTARADAQTTDSTIDERTDSLKIRFEAPWGHVVRVADIPTHDRSLSTDFATFGHDFLAETRSWALGVPSWSSGPGELHIIA